MNMNIDFQKSNGLVPAIIQDELTGDVALIVTDNIDDEDAEDTSNLWISQVAKLKHMIGS